MLAPVLALAFMQQQDHDKASYLYHACQGAIRFMDGNGRSGDLSEAQSCLAYIDGFTDGANFFERHICLADASVATFARIYLKWIDKDPRRMEYSKRMALTGALAEAYPCTK